MAVPKMDGRDREQIVAAMERLAAAYTPEWRFDLEHPDVGTALALIYGELFAQTVSRFDRCAEKYRIAFHSLLGARLLPALPAEGYVCFGLAGQPEEGVPVERGAQLLAAGGGDEQDLLFETQNDVLVTPAHLEALYFVDGVRDFIGRAGGTTDAFSAFCPAGENLQEHAFYLCCGDVLDIGREAVITLELRPYRLKRFPARLLEALRDGLLWEYESEDGFVPFQGVELDGERLIFTKGADGPFVRRERLGRQGFWIRCGAPDARPFDAFTIAGCTLASRGEGIPPDVLSGAGVEQPFTGAFAFGEKMGLYDALYLGCGEALGKRGAKIRLEFDLRFIKIPIDLDVADPSVNWKLIMRRSDFKPDREYDITVEEVLWEYYNGLGWARLFPDHTYGSAFNLGSGNRHVEMEFECPEDMAPYLLDAHETCFIRARILRLNNAFKVKGNYLSPFIEEVLFQYDYAGGPKPPESIHAVNSLEWEEIIHPGGSSYFIMPFRLLPDDRPALYLAFDLPPADGPVKLLFLMEETLERQSGRLLWEALGHGGWRPLNVVDETENLRRTGIVTVMGGRDFARKPLWDREACWLRVVDATGYTREGASPRLKGIHLNAVDVRGVETRPPEFFTAEGPGPFSCKLSAGSIQSLAVWVRETGRLTPGERERLAAQGRLDSGLPEEDWVLWLEDGDPPEGDRRYTADRNEGVVTFPGGGQAFTPPNRPDGIRISYTTGGGIGGNLPPGRIDRSNRALGFVSQIWNPAATAGGCDRETVPQALARSAAALSHRYRAVTPRDFENLAMEAARGILRARCFPGRNARGEPSPGCVTLVLLQRDYRDAPDYFDTLRGQVLDYIARRVDGNLARPGRLAVVEPQFLKLDVKAELAVKSLNGIFAVRSGAAEHLAGFLDPVTGNFDGKGWEIGETPNRTQIMNCLKAVPGVSFLRDFVLTAYTGGGVEADLERREGWVFAQPLSGNHELVLTVE